MCTLTVEQQKNTNTDKMETYPPLHSWTDQNGQRVKTKPCMN